MIRGTPSPPSPSPKEARGGVDLNLLPSPPWGRGWTAAGVFTSRGGTGEGVILERTEGETLLANF